MVMPTQHFVEQIQKRWGDSKRVAMAAINETFNHEDLFSFDHDDQVGTAMEIGILVGQTEKETAQVFIERFTQFLCEQE